MLSYERNTLGDGFKNQCSDEYERDDCNQMSLFSNKDFKLRQWQLYNCKIVVVNNSQKIYNLSNKLRIIIQNKHDIQVILFDCSISEIRQSI